MPSGLNNTPSGERIHISIFGRRNAGKSSLINALTNQQLAIVSEKAGTTTDPVSKAMELLPLGPVLITDTAGLDDSGSLGEQRIKKSMQVLRKTDIAIIVTDENEGISDFDRDIIENVKRTGIPYIIVFNKADDTNEEPEGNTIKVSAKNGNNINRLRELIAECAKTEDENKRICAGLIDPNDIAVLVVPIDSAAPKGRLILPQQQTIRDILEYGGAALVCRETELKETLEACGKKPKLVITDSQAFEVVSKTVPENIPLTSFSILMARYKGYLEQAVGGVAAIDKLTPDSKILISEGCTHHRQCEDIGTVKLPKLLHKHLGFKPDCSFSSGTEFPEDLSQYSLVIHCGACMLNEREMKYRRSAAAEQNVPITNYGICIAYLTGVLKRSLELFPSLYAMI